MSYEGQTKLLCENGHLDIFDAYDTPHVMSWKCRHCGAKAAWVAHVDQTNGQDPKTGLCSGDFRLKVLSRHECKCPKCGNKHAKAPVQYRIPRRGRIRR